MLATPLFMSFLIGCVEVEDQKTSLFLKIKIDPGDIPVEEYVVGDEIDYIIVIVDPEAGGFVDENGIPLQEGILNEGPLYTTSIQNALLSDDE